MHYVYILQLGNRQLYAGLTTDVARRLREHRSGKSPFTRHRLPIRLVYCELFIHHEDAMRRERYFKTSKGKVTLRLMLRETLARR